MSRVKFASFLAALIVLTACHQRRPDNTDLKGVPPLVHEELSWESFFYEPWPDPLHGKYEELFNAPFPNHSLQHFAVNQPFADVLKYDLAFDATAVPGTHSETESGGGKHAVSMQLPASAGKPVVVQVDAKNIRLSVRPSLPAHRYRVYRTEEKIIPLPEGADPDTARVVRDGEWVRIKFNSKDAKKPAPQR